MINKTIGNLEVKKKYGQLQEGMYIQNAIYKIKSYEILDVLTHNLIITSALIIVLAKISSQII